MDDRESRLRHLAARRSRLATALTAVVVVVYFGFIALVGYDKPLLGRLLAPGLSLGIVLGALVIVVSWMTTWVYVRWTNRVYDVEIERLR